MFRVVSRGSFSRTSRFLTHLKSGDIYRQLDQHGRRGVEALSAATPRDTGATAEAWTYNIERSRGKVVISWNNTNDNQGAKIAVLIQYGHGTGTGGFVHGQDYINPAIQPVFDKIASDVWKQVTNG
jgi:hypothetical protein